MTAVNSPASGFAPLRQPTFAVLWAATVLGNTGIFMRDVTSAWLITDLSAAPAAVALTQVAGSLPIFLLAIPAGVLADIFDRRRFLIAGQAFLAAVSAALLLLAQAQLISVDSLIALTLLGGIGAALMGPTWQAIVPELVGKESLRSAVALNSLGVNIARSIGPAVGGLLLATFGAAVTYGVNALSCLVVIAALFWWRRASGMQAALPEQFSSALRAGLRYARASRALRRVLLRAAAYFVFTSAIWALLPLVAKDVLGGTAGFYGLLLGAVGMGAIVGAVLLPRLQGWLTPNGLLLAAALATAFVMGSIALAPPQWLAFALLLLLGAAWIITLTTLNVTAQAILPNWVRGRGLAIYLTIFNGALAGGSLLWGLAAQQTGVASTLVVAAAGLLIIAIVLHRLQLPAVAIDLMPSGHWPEPLMASAIEHERGPVTVLVHYHVAQSDRDAFLAALRPWSEERRRDGASAWGVCEDTGDATHIMEWFTLDSWAEHLRQHQRVSNLDATVQRELLRYQIGGQAPTVQHFVALPIPPAP